MTNIRSCSLRLFVLGLLVFFLFSETLASERTHRLFPVLISRDTFRFRDTLQIYFHRGYSNLDLSYRENGVNLHAFVLRFRALQRDSLSFVKGVRVRSGASPDGNSVFNVKLSQSRASRIVDYLMKSEGLEGDLIEVKSVGIDWEGLYKKVQASSMPNKARVLDIIRNTPLWIRKNGVIVDGRKFRLMNLEGGDAWRYMERHFFPDLRATFVEVVYYTAEEREQLLYHPTVASVPKPTEEKLKAPQEEIIFAPMVRPAREPFLRRLGRQRLVCPPLALRTNLLFDLALVPNIGVEFSLGRGWTLGGHYSNGWWRKSDRDWWWRLEGMELDLRRYLNRRGLAFRRHHLGVYGHVVTYDLTFSGTGYLGRRWSYGGGVSYGYMAPLGRRLSMDFEVGVGYLGGEYDQYEMQDGHRVWQSRRDRHWFGPTRAGISLVWLLGWKNINFEKGGWL